MNEKESDARLVRVHECLSVGGRIGMRVCVSREREREREEAREFCIRNACVSWGMRLVLKATAAAAATATAAAAALAFALSMHSLKGGKKMKK